MLFDKLPHGALVVDRSGTVLMANRKAGDTFAKLIGRPPKPGDVLDDLLADPRPLLMEDVRAAASGGRLGLLVVPGHPAIRLRVTAVRPAGPYILSMSDTDAIDTAFGRMRTELREANSVASRERRMRQEAELAYSAMETFSTIAAHDLKQPLRNISDLLSFLVEDFADILPDDAMALITKAQQSAGRLQGLIGDLLRHARLGSEPMETVEIDIATVLAEITLDFAPRLAESGGQIKQDGPLGTLVAVPQLFRLLLENLISNALKYRSHDRAPVVRLRRSHGGRRLEVEDNGAGFDPAAAKKMFQPFTRLATDPDIEGSGIGLASCRTIALRHGWSIHAEGRPGDGATFYVDGLI